jgi:hypothetical protein
MASLCAGRTIKSPAFSTSSYIRRPDQTCRLKATVVLIPAHDRPDFLTDASQARHLAPSKKWGRISTVTRRQPVPCGRSIVRLGSEFRRQVAVDLEPDANLNDAWSCPRHGTSSCKIQGPCPELQDDRAHVNKVQSNLFSIVIRLTYREWAVLR